LLEKADGETRGEDCLSVKLFIFTSNDAQQGALPGAIQTEDADFSSVKIREGDVLQNHSLIVILTDADHGVNDFL